MCGSSHWLRLRRVFVAFCIGLTATLAIYFLESLRGCSNSHSQNLYAAALSAFVLVASKFSVLSARQTWLSRVTAHLLFRSILS